MEAKLRRRDFDVAGVKAEEGSPVTGFVRRDELRDGGVVRDHIRPILAEHLVSDATPLATLLSVLRTREHVFVITGPDVTGIVARGDLNKPPVRTYLFGIISLLEMHLTFWVTALYPGEQWKKAISAKRAARAEKLLALRRSRGHQTYLVDCLQFCDKSDLVVAQKALREDLGLGGKRKASDFLGAAEKLRDLLAHSQSDLADGSSWNDVIDLVKKIERTVHNSDELVEARANQSASSNPDGKGLWRSA